MKTNGKSRVIAERERERVFHLKAARCNEGFSLFVPKRILKYSYETRSSYLICKRYRLLLLLLLL